MSAITAKASRKMKKYAVLTREPRCFLGSFDFLGNSVRFKMLLTALIICVSLLQQIFEFTEQRRIMEQTEFRIMWRDLHTMENLSLLLKMERMT